MEKILLTLVLLSIAQACRTSVIESRPSTSQSEDLECRPKNIDIDVEATNEEIKALASEIVKNHFRKSEKNYVDLSKRIVKKLEESHRQNPFHWNCAVGSDFGVVFDRFKYSLFMFNIGALDSTTKLGVFCVLF